MGEDAPVVILMLSVMGAVAEFERTFIRERRWLGRRWRTGHRRNQRIVRANPEGCSIRTAAL